MSAQLMGACWQVRNLSRTERLVLLKMADHADKEHSRAWPSIQAVATACELRERAVQRAVRKLEARGLLRREAEAKGRRPAVYRVCVIEALRGVSRDTPKEGARGDAEDTSGMSPETVRGVISDIAIKEEPSGTVNEPRAGAAAPPDFPDPPPETDDDTYPVVERLAWDVVNGHRDEEDWGELAELLKRECARHAIDYSGDVVHRALRSVLHKSGRAHRSTRVDEPRDTAPVATCQPRPQEARPAIFKAPGDARALDDGAVETAFLGEPVHVRAALKVQATEIWKFDRFPLEPAVRDRLILRGALDLYAKGHRGAVAASA